MVFKKLNKEEQRENDIELAVEKYIEQLDDDRSNLTDQVFDWIDANLNTRLTKQERKLLHQKNELQYKLEQQLTDDQIVKIRIIDYLSFRIGEEKLITACTKLLKK